MIRVSDASSPTATPATAPVVLNRRQVKASSRAGKFAAADTDSASPTEKATLKPDPARAESTTATTAIAPAP
ncbi:hypothetical protein DSM104299_01831 [Baekduia alba]|uniref:hypothetical protein n=1 Tax=Baekduia alba TaxID=2997333 RepID=UPI002341A26C|nr:hypothetical protein [Baekduia alba]WCB93128.1 hypothetical protein DSM104299_01831 [Baekduia alba]